MNRYVTLNVAILKFMNSVLSIINKKCPIMYNRNGGWSDIFINLLTGANFLGEL